MKVLMVITGLGMGGAEKVVTSLADQLVEKGHEVVIAYMTGKALVTPKSNSIELIHLGANSAKDLYRAYFKLRQVIKSFKPDVVHSHLVHANILCRTLRLTTSMPRLISSAHNTDEEGWTRFLAYRLTDRLADISTNVSDKAVEAFIEQKAVRPDRILALYNGISTTEFVFSEQARSDTRKELGISENQQLILAVGRLDESKDHANLLSAVSIISTKNQDIKIAIAGQGPLLEELENKARVLGISDRVCFLGIRTDIPQLMSAADIFVLPSAWEGFGLVVAEAMACERVVVATDSGGVKEVVGDAGFLVPPKDSVALSKALQQALALSSTERLQLGKKTRHRILHNYSLDMATDKWLRLYSASKNELSTSLLNDNIKG